jgi:hypothetical protein
MPRSRRARSTSRLVRPVGRRDVTNGEALARLACLTLQSHDADHTEKPRPKPGGVLCCLRRAYDPAMTDELRAKVFRDRISHDVWRVAKMDSDGGYEAIEIFSCLDARQRATDYARHHFGEFDEIELEPYR